MRQVHQNESILTNALSHDWQLVGGLFHPQNLQSIALRRQSGRHHQIAGKIDRKLKKIMFVKLQILEFDFSMKISSGY